MKRKLLLLVMLLCIAQISNSQTIDITGVGTLGSVGLGNRNLSLTNVENISKVDVAAIFRGGIDAMVNNTDVQFYDNDEGPFSTFHPKADLIVKHFSPSFGETVGYFSGTFNTFDNSGVNVAIGPINDVPSFYAFIYRDVPDATYKSYISPEVSFYYRNGSNDAYTYSIPINTASSSRNVKIKIPITELDDGTIRKAVIDISAGSITKHVEVNLFNLGNSFFLGEYLLENVPGGVSEVTVSIYSPNDLIGEDPGDSFFVNGIVADVDIVEEGLGCTLTQGYWKTHSKYDGDKYDNTWAEIGEDSNFYLSSKSYYKTLKKSPRGNKYYILAHQFIAAKLNFLNGADPTDAQEAFDKATSLFEQYTPSQIADLNHNRSKRAKRIKRKFVKLAKILDEYNNGIIGPGHCDEGEEEENPCLTKDDIIVTPNPVVTYGTVKFTPTHTGRTVVYMYNSYGQFVCPLYDKNITEGEEVDFTFNARYYRSGTYYLKVWSGCCVVVKRIVIHCY